MDGRTDGQMDGWMDGRMDGRIDGNLLASNFRVEHFQPEITQKNSQGYGMTISCENVSCLLCPSMGGGGRFYATGQFGTWSQNGNRLWPMGACEGTWI